MQIANQMAVVRRRAGASGMHVVPERAADPDKDASGAPIFAPASRSGLGRRANVAQAAGRTPQQVAAALREIIVFIVFLVFFTAESVRSADLQDKDVYRFGAIISQAILDEPLSEQHAPTYKMTLRDIRGVDEVKYWLQGPFVKSVFSMESAVVNNTLITHEGAQHGINKIIGAVRVAQLRAKIIDCNNQMPSALARTDQKYRWNCVGSPGKGTQFSYSDESVEDFGELSYFYENGTRIGTKGGAFLFNGRDAQSGLKRNLDVEGARSVIYSPFATRELNYYPVPAFGMIFDPTMGEEHAAEAVRDMLLSNYIDIQTKALFIDFSVFNPMLNRVCWARVTFEMTKAGGVVASLSYEVARLWQLSDDFAGTVLFVIVAAFYAIFILQEARELCLVGWRIYVHDLGNALQLLNIVFWMLSHAFRYASSAYIPDIWVDQTNQFVDLWVPIRLHGISTVFLALTVFFNWYKLITFLSYAPTFAIMESTLVKSAKGVGSFAVIFFILLYGFAQAHAHVFGGRIENFSTMDDTAFTLLRSLLGDFDFEEMQAGHSVMGPLFFVCFVVLCVFIVLNMFIAIISDAYSETVEEASHKKKVKLMKEIRQFLWDSLRGIPCLGKYVRKLHNTARRASMSLHRNPGSTDAKATAYASPQSRTAARLFTHDAQNNGINDGDKSKEAQIEIALKTAATLESVTKLQATHADSVESLQSEIVTLSTNVSFLRDQMQQLLAAMGRMQAETRHLVREANSIQSSDRDHRSSSKAWTESDDVVHAMEEQAREQASMPGAMPGAQVGVNRNFSKPATAGVMQARSPTGPLTPLSATGAAALMGRRASIDALGNMSFEV